MMDSDYNHSGGEKIHNKTQIKIIKMNVNEKIAGISTKKKPGCIGIELPGC